MKDKRGNKPTVYTDAAIRKVLSYVALGNSLAKAAKHYGLEYHRVAKRLYSKHAQFGEEMRRAREMQVHAYVDEIVDIADDCIDSKKAFVRINARKWLASKIVPKIYGDNVGKDIDTKPVIVNIDMSPVKDNYLKNIKQGRPIVAALTSPEQHDTFKPPPKNTADYSLPT